MTIWRAVAEGGVVPKGYGIAWFEMLEGLAWCLPLPLNLIAGWSRRVWHWAIACSQPSALDYARAQGYRAGRWRTLQSAHDEAERIAAQLFRLDRIAREAGEK